MNGRSKVGRSRDGFTLVEVVVIATLLVLVIAGLIRGIIAANQMNYLSAQRVAAFGLCRQRYEQMRAVPRDRFATLTSTNALLATTPVRITHLGGAQAIALTGTCSVAMADFNSPRRKHVTVRVNWEFKGRAYQESASGVLYDKN